jgi:hypothetical protein
MGEEMSASGAALWVHRETTETHETESCQHTYRKPQLCCYLRLKLLNQRSSLSNITSANAQNNVIHRIKCSLLSIESFCIISRSHKLMSLLYNRGKSLTKDDL